MAKIALLIGVSDYGEGLSGLPGTQEDIRAMQCVLRSPQIGEFDTVEVLPNPDRTQMESAIETLFTENRSRDDLILLYFSGHGVRDDNGTLYFATCGTTKNSQGRIRTSTAVPAIALQDYMSRSRSKRQVLILDCCFSGAFANDMKAKQADEAIDVKMQLGGEGRAVLTSSTATQVSYEKEGASIYTRYLVEGLETGAADRDGNGQITVDELHGYAKEKVQEAAPTMQPEIYAVREGYKILLARAPQGDPRLTYRKELDERAKQKRGKLSPVDQRALKYRWQELGLSSQDAETIANEVLQPYETFWAKLNEFEQAVKETLSSSQLDAVVLSDLRYFQRVLRLRDEDITPILSAHNLNLNLSPTSGSSSVIDQGKQGKPAGKETFEEFIEGLLRQTQDQQSLDELYADLFRQTQNVYAKDDLSSEKGIDYRELRDLLEAQDWKAADYETYLRMLEVVGRKEGDWIRPEELANFPCTDLKTIDRLWVNYSNGHFGFSVQKKTWQECGFPRLSGKNWNLFCVKVGWMQNQQATEYVPYPDLKFDLQFSPKGELPLYLMTVRRAFRFWGGGWSLFSSLAQRLIDCGASSPRVF